MSGSAVAPPARERPKASAASGRAAARFGRIAGGQEDLKGKIFRVGHMGTVSFEELGGGLMAIERELRAQGASIKSGAWVEAFTAHMP